MSFDEIIKFRGGGENGTVSHKQKYKITQMCTSSENINGYSLQHDQKLFVQASFCIKHMYQSPTIHL